MRLLLVAGTAGLAIVLIVLLLRDLMPPRELSFAAGPEGGGYWQVAERYRDILARDGIELRLVASQGSVANANLLATREVDAALLQGGVTAPSGVEALGAVFVEPMFVFVRSGVEAPPNAGGWSGLRLAGGAPGSGTRAAVDALLQAARLENDEVELQPLGGAGAVDALLAGAVDVAVFVAPIEAPYLQPLFWAPEVELLSLTHVRALSRRLRSAEVVPLLAGSLSLLPAVPPEDVPLIAMIARLVADEDLHPALVDRLVEAAREVHGGRSVLAEAGEYPSFDAVAMPMNLYARDLLVSGPSPLRTLLPYWIVAQINRFAILLLPILLLVVPLLRSAPGLYAWRMRYRVDRYYNDIRKLDVASLQASDPAELRAIDERLAETDARIAALRLPLPYRNYAYSARLHVDLLRKRIAERLAAGA